MIVFHFFNGFYQINHQTQKLFWFPDVVIVTALGGSSGLDNFLEGDEYVEFRNNGTIYYAELKKNAVKLSNGFA